MVVVVVVGVAVVVASAAGEDSESSVTCNPEIISSAASVDGSSVIGRWEGLATRFGGLCLEAKSEARRFEAFSLTDELSPEANCPLANLQKPVFKSFWIYARAYYLRGNEARIVWEGFY